MIYQIIRALLGPHGRWILDFIVEYQVIIFSVIFVLFFIHELRADPEARTGWYLDLNLEEKLSHTNSENKDE